MEEGHDHGVGNIVPRFEARVKCLSILDLLSGLRGLDVLNQRVILESGEDVWRISLHGGVDLSGTMSAQVEQKIKAIQYSR